MLEEASISWVGRLGSLLGVNEPALRLLFGILAGYPLALAYRKYIFNQTETIKCSFLFLSGLIIGTWNFGIGMFHCVLSIIFTFITISLLQGIFMVALVFGFTFTYLIVGYWYSSTDNYDITWTMPYCILVLRLTGVAFDVYDGSRPKDVLSSDAMKTRLKERPGLLQILGHALFPTAFLIGPQFSMRRYLDFINGKFNSKGPKGEPQPPASVDAALKRFAQAVIYLAIFQILSIFIYDDMIISDEFVQMGIFKRLFLLGVWGRYILYKYISCWLLTEGACILFGISYNGEDEETKLGKWNGVANIRLSVFENATEFNHYIISFNVNTNQWVAQHIYKRLKFLNNKYYSQAGVLLFLAVWHGLHSGYYVTFLHEFVVIFAERDFQSLVKSYQPASHFFSNAVVKNISLVVLRMYTFIFMGWSLLPFVYLQLPKYWIAFGNCNYAGFLLFYFWPIIYSPMIKKLIKAQKHPK